VYLRCRNLLSRANASIDWHYSLHSSDITFRTTTKVPDHVLDTLAACNFRVRDTTRQDSARQDPPPCPGPRSPTSSTNYLLPSTDRTFPNCPARLSPTATRYFRTHSPIPLRSLVPSSHLHARKHPTFAIAPRHERKQTRNQRSQHRDIATHQSQLPHGSLGAYGCALLNLRRIDSVRLSIRLTRQPRREHGGLRSA
jgi:hypothetical protein